LIELMMTVVVVAVLTSIAAPYFRDLILNNQLSGYTNTLVQAAHAARIEAIKRTQQIRVSAMDSSSATNEWGPGLVVYLDVNANAAFDAGTDEEIRRFDAVRGRQTIDGPDGMTGFDFLPDGGVLAATVPVTFQVCDGRTGETGRVVTITQRGEVRTTDVVCG
jgi:type IV fimbrial biogenesis protein FimT